jgi:hypothetical protein
MSAHDHAHTAPHPVTALFELPLPEGKARDPVCGMTVTAATAQHKAEQGARPPISAPMAVARNSSAIPRNI